MLVLGNEEGVEFLWTRKQDGGWVLGQCLDFSRRRSAAPVTGVGDSRQMYNHQAREGMPACPSWRLRTERMRRIFQDQGEGHQAPKGCYWAASVGFVWVCLFHFIHPVSTSVPTIAAVGLENRSVPLESSEGGFVNCLFHMDNREARAKLRCAFWLFQRTFWELLLLLHPCQLALWLTHKGVPPMLVEWIYPTSCGNDLKTLIKTVSFINLPFTSDNSIAAVCWWLQCGAPALISGSTHLTMAPILGQSLHTHSNACQSDLQTILQNMN